MSKYDYGKRLKELFDHERSLRRKEIETAKSIHEYNKKLTDAKMIKTQIEEERSELIKLEKYTKNIKLLNDKLRMKLEHSQRMLVKSHQEKALKLPQQKEREEHVIQEMNNFYCFQSHTKIFFNVRKLPKLIQGLIFSEQENACKLFPFKIDPEQHSHEDVMEILWEKQHISGTYKDHWRYVIFGECVVDNEMHIKKDDKAEANEDLT